MTNETKQHDQPNPLWTCPRDGECVGVGFDDKGIFNDFYNAATDTIYRVYLNLDPTIP